MFLLAVSSGYDDLGRVVSGNKMETRRGDLVWTYGQTQLSAHLMYIPYTDTHKIKLKGLIRFHI